MNDFKEAFERKKNDEYWDYQKKVAKLESDQGVFAETLAQLRSHGIVLLDNNVVQEMFRTYNINLYKMCEDKCRAWNRPYIKCVQTGWKRIVVSVTGTGQARGLVANLLMTAEEIKPSTKMVKRKNGLSKVEVIDTPDPIANTGMELSTAYVRSWVTARTVTVLFQHDKGLEMFRGWQEFCRTDRMQRLYLGL